MFKSSTLTVLDLKRGQVLLPHGLFLAPISVTNTVVHPFVTYFYSYLSEKV